METVCIGGGMHRAWAVLVASADRSFAVLTCGNCLRPTHLAEVLIPACVARVIIGDMAIQANLLAIVAARKITPRRGHDPRLSQSLVCAEKPHSG